jgi:hypothetical protein
MTQSPSKLNSRYADAACRCRLTRPARALEIKPYAIPGPPALRQINPADSAGGHRQDGIFSASRPAASGGGLPCGDALR